MDVHTLTWRFIHTIVFFRRVHCTKESKCMGVMVQRYTCVKEMVRENHALGGPGVTDAPTSAAGKGHHFEGAGGRTVSEWGRGGAVTHQHILTHMSTYVHTHLHTYRCNHTAYVTLHTIQQYTTITMLKDVWIYT